MDKNKVWDKYFNTIEEARHYYYHSVDCDGLLSVPMVITDEGKRPLVRWSEIKSKEQSDNAFKQFKDAEVIAVIPYNNFITIDLDKQEIADKFLGELQKYEGLYQKCWVVRTKRGLHIHFKAPHKMDNLSTKDIEVYSDDKHLIIMPPSKFEGGYYEFLIEDNKLNPLGTLTNQEVNQIELLIDKIAKKGEISLKELELKAVLSKEVPIYQSIGIGLKDDVFYIGIKLYKNNEYFDAVITSDKTIYRDLKNRNEIREDFGLNYRYPFYRDVIDNFWSNTGEYGVEKWLFGDKKVTIKETFEEVYKLIKWKYWNPDETVYKHHALSILSTYFLPIFEAKGRELIYGEHGWGKSRLCKIYQQLAFNPVMSADFSDASIYRIIESSKATIIIDNFDDVDDEKKKKIKHIYNVGYLKHQKAVRSEGKTFKPTGFDIYSSLILNTRTSLDEVLESRSNITRNMKTDKSEYRNLEDKNPIWKEARDKLYYSTLENWKDVANTYSSLKEERLISRELERVEGTLTIAKTISDELYEEMIGFYLKDNKRRNIKDLKDDWVYLAVEEIVRRLKDANKTEIELYVKDIVEKVAQDLGWTIVDKNYERQKRSLSIRLGSVFRNSSVFESRSLDGCTLYKFTIESLIVFCRAKDYGEEIIKSIKQLGLNEGGGGE